MVRTISGPPQKPIALLLKLEVRIKLSLHEGQRQGVNLHFPVPNTPVENQLERQPLLSISKKGFRVKSQTSLLLLYKKKFPAKPFTPSASTLAPRSRKSAEIASVLNKEGRLNSEEQAQREREGLCLYCGGKHELDSCVKRIALMLQECDITNDVPCSRFILFDSLNQPYRNSQSEQSLPLTDINSSPVYFTKWTFHFSNFPSFKWDLM
ncbi:hypothetical protein VP01_2932g6, partial [Puccinia sorghi]